MKRIFSLVLTVIMGFIPVASAHASAPDTIATGAGSYNAYGLQRFAEFNVRKTSESCRVDWNISGKWQLTVDFNGQLYKHDAEFTQEGGVVSGTGSYPSGGPATVTWTLVNSTVSGNMVHLELDYDNSNYAAIFDGEINADGRIHGNWSSNANQSGIWKNTQGRATATLEGCSGKGKFHYKDLNRNAYHAEVKYVNSDGDNVWFAAQIYSATNQAWVGSWVFVKVYDGDKPGAGIDQIWGSFSGEAAAKMGVATKTSPADGPFTLISGNYQVL